ncbi:unnamed protein product [Chilo suppressalis]|uniref:MULE transposase domain-containing protein n=1 Tax=Chilo suppressalis TaxID=168631 RepID=A0ABN8BF72_CHISP|nr:unnamed protein product [Chilo suppressalis]
MDFEVPAVLAIRSILPDAKILGCFFHLARCLWRKAKQLGATKSKHGKIYVKLCSVLSHLPLHLISEEWLYKMEDCPKGKGIIAFDDYFVSTWLENDIYFPIWCTYNKDHKTNNIVVWHNHVKRYMKSKINFLNGIMKDGSFYCNKLKKTNNISRRSAETVATKEKINLTLQELINGQITVGHCLEKLRL